MKRLLFKILFFVSIIEVYGQEYLDSKFYYSDRQNATYYRITDSLSNPIKIKTYYINDSLFEIQQYKSLNPRIKHGKNIQYFKNGQVKYNIDYVDDMINGNVIGYYENGQLRRKDLYQNDIFISGYCYTKDGKDTAHYLYMKPPSFKNGGLEDFRKFVEKNLKYPPKAAARNIQGQVIIEFCVNSKGYVVDIEIVSTPDVLLGKAAKRAVAFSPRWKPGIFEGKPLKFKYTIPIVFVLQK